MPLLPAGPSAYLSWTELACQDGTPYPEDWRQTRARVLAQEFEAIRRAVGQPLAILSAYRTPAHNRAVGGAAQSRHVEGMALDLRPPEGWTAAQLGAACVARAHHPDSAIGGIGRYPTFVHIDIRPRPADGQVVRWTGTSRRTGG